MLETVVIFGKPASVTLPGFAAREEVSTAAHTLQSVDPTDVRLLRVFSAAIGLCTPCGRASGLSYVACKFDVLDYGGQVFDWLRQHGATTSEVIAAGAALLSAIRQDLYPRAAEVDEALGNSGADGLPPSPPAADGAPPTAAPPTVPPSA